MDPPNVIIYASHDTGRHISPYGVATVHTPNAARVAREGVLFRNAFATAPSCSASRASLFTGRYPHAAGVSGLARASTGFTLTADSVHLANHLKRRRYRTALFGLAHEATGGDSPPAHLDALKFDYRKHGYLAAGELVDDFERWLSNQDSSAPFYAQICPAETHRDFRIGNAQPDRSLGVTVPPYLKRSKALRKDLAWFQGSIRNWDVGLGRILSIIDSKLATNTLLIVTTDHGIPYPRAKASLYDAGLEVMLLMRYPTVLKAATTHDELISNVDIVPTILEAVGGSPAGGRQGRSFWPLLTAAEYQQRDRIFAERTFHTSYDPVRSVRTSRYKYIRNFESVRPDWYYSEGVDRHRTIRGVKHSARIMRQSDPKNRPWEEIYDLRSDPLELDNLAERREHAATRQELARALCRWMRDTDDPLLQGPIPSPTFLDNIRALQATDP